VVPESADRRRRHENVRAPSGFRYKAQESQPVSQMWASESWRPFFSVQDGPNKSDKPPPKDAEALGKALSWGYALGPVDAAGLTLALSRACPHGVMFAVLGRGAMSRLEKWSDFGGLCRSLPPTPAKYVQKADRPNTPRARERD
jgi:hypothetical protein